jgi:predicted nucleic acid-binding protein
VLRRGVRLKKLSPARAKEAIEDLFAWDLERLSHRPLLRIAWSLRDRVTTYDALYVASARLHGAALVTADGPLSRTPGLDIVIQNVRLQ